jgi:hypothetical protein
MRAMSPRQWLRMPLPRPGPRWAWALLLALLLPLTQAVAASHAITHHATPSQQRDAAPSALDATCVQCLLATPIGAGAPPCTPPAFLAPSAAHATPEAPALVEPSSALALAYRSRAPPSRLH